MHAARAEWPFARQPPSMVVLRWLTRMVLVPFAIFGGFSGYRAWVQVKSVALFVPDRDLRSAGPLLGQPAEKPGHSTALVITPWAFLYPAQGLGIQDLGTLYGDQVSELLPTGTESATID